MNSGSQKPLPVLAFGKRRLLDLTVWTIIVILSPSTQSVVARAAAPLYHFETSIRFRPATLKISTRHQQQSPNPPGRLVDLGDRRLHVNCTGKGAPTVVVETGLG